MTQSSALPQNPFDANNQVGSIGYVSLSFAELLIPAVKTDSGDTVAAFHGQVGDYLFIQCDKFAIFGQLSDLKAATATSTEEAASLQKPAAVGRIDLLTTLQIDTGDIFPGVLVAPRIGNKVFAATPGLIQFVVESQNRSHGKSAKLQLSFARLPNANNIPVSFTPESLFGRHLAILGTTGGGKSWTTARLIEESAKYKSKLILFDAVGEYHRLEEGVTHLHIGDDPRPLEGSTEVVLPYYHLTEGDLFAIFNPSGPSQAPKLRAAMKSLKLAKQVSSLAPNGTIIKAHKSKIQFEQEYRRNIDDIESKFANFDIHKLTSQIENECVDPQRSVTEPEYWGGPNGNDYSFCVPMINRIEDLLSNSNLNPIFYPGKKASLFHEIRSFLKDSSKRILRISLKYLSFDHHAREIAANAIGRYLLELARKNHFRRQPLLVVLDEAHQFLNKTLGDDSFAYPLDSFALIAKEGRKYSINISITTQRPRDIPEGVLSQMGTLLVHRLINDRDRSVIERASTEIDHSSIAAIPTLAPGEAVILGVDFPLPLFVRVDPPKNKPDSKGPDYQKHWSKKSVEVKN